MVQETDPAQLLKQPSPVPNEPKEVPQPPALPWVMSVEAKFQPESMATPYQRWLAAVSSVAATVPFWFRDSVRLAIGSIVLIEPFQSYCEVKSTLTTSA